MNIEIIKTYKEMLKMVESLRIRVSLGASDEKRIIYDRQFLVLKELLYDLIISQYENK